MVQHSQNVTAIFKIPKYEQPNAHVQENLFCESKSGCKSFVKQNLLCYVTCRCMRGAGGGSRVFCPIFAESWHARTMGQARLGTGRGSQIR